MNNKEILSKTYEKLNPENQRYALGVLQTLKYAQDVLIKKQTTEGTERQTS